MYVNNKKLQRFIRSLSAALASAVRASFDTFYAFRVMMMSALWPVIVASETRANDIKMNRIESDDDERRDEDEAEE